VAPAEASAPREDEAGTCEMTSMHIWQPRVREMPLDFAGCQTTRRERI
jgi:hypothetical protein